MFEMQNRERARERVMEILCVEFLCCVVYKPEKFCEEKDRWFIGLPTFLLWNRFFGKQPYFWNLKSVCFNKPSPTCLSVFAC